MKGIIFFGLLYFVSVLFLTKDTGMSYQAAAIAVASGTMYKFMERLDESQQVGEKGIPRGYEGSRRGNCER